jgi:kynureninase
VTSTSFASERSRFPVLIDRTYFAQQCLGAYPAAMMGDLTAYVDTLTRRSRALPEWADRWTEIHSLIEQLIAAAPGSVFIRDSATAAQAAIAAALSPQGDRKRVIIGSGDFHSSRYLWRAQERRGFEIVELPTHGSGALDEGAIAESIDERVRVVALSLVSPRSGALLDVKPIAHAARRAGAVFVLDVFQAIGIVPVRVGELGASAIVGGFHKWVGGGGTGIAFGWVDAPLLQELEPVYPGWIGSQDLFAFSDAFVPAAGAEKLQQGMPAMEAVYTSRAGIKWILAQGIDRIRDRNLELTGRLIALGREHGLRITTPAAPARRGGMVCIEVAGAKQLVLELEREGIDIDARPGAGIRVGPHACATEDECDTVIRSVVRRVM